MINAFLGGLGLFLVGMWLMTDGLKLAAGNALRGILQTWTNSRYRGLLTGFGITALVQSSSAVTVATIGFANAGLLTLERAIWVIFGSNLGTTMTGWIVAFVGLKFDIDTYALPLIGIGMLVRLTGQKSRRAALGQALVGFGLFFLGIGVLKEAFESIGSSIELPGAQQADIASMLLFVLLGFVLTSLMQSSSAAIVITLSAADSGLISLGTAAATVIGANLGTTTTAVIAVVGATSTAKRVATGHILFNLMTASVAIIIILPMLTLIHFVQDFFNLSTANAASLALFHTVFNLLGVLLMLPLSDRMLRFLNSKFIDKQEQLAKPLYLDKTSMEVPELALDALVKELGHLQSIATDACIAAIDNRDGNTDTVQLTRDSIEKLATRIAENVARLMQAGISEAVAAVLPEILLNTQRASMNVDNAVDVVERTQEIDIVGEPPEVINDINNFRKLAVSILRMLDEDSDSAGAEQAKRLEILEGDYDRVRRDVLFAGARGQMAMLSIDAQLTQLNLIRRIARQAAKTGLRYQQVKSMLSNGNKPAAEQALPPDTPQSAPG